MSDVVHAAPPPPPPPPPPRAVGPATSFDFVKPFTFTFEDPRWVQKILIGGLFMLASVFIVGMFFLYGYIGRLVRNVANGVERPLPEWDDLGGICSEGLRLTGVAFVYMLPMFAVFGVFLVPAIIASGVAQSADNDFVRNIGGAAPACVWCLIFPLGLALLAWVPAALLFAAIEQRFGAAFEFGRIWAFIKANIGNYLLAFIVWLVVRMVVPFGLILFCVGIIFTGFWSLLVASHAFGQVWRFAPRSDAPSAPRFAPRSDAR